ncbi:hypothetical protein CC1G_13152 [Coprinopsis cinerea okayama7|uniref:CxC2-like cysteine cluster KDZ transposase-associated domain-containing protein n=1 Tax=Coprinopsis cinerea (strain Okayama-7 / 130 / ATCC MYA-4618 / FGSC 9003) TaxID=240176 RepID=A8P3E3_COPC7|nr:hypothetical protein CC1G_13152 [Coprinopsis cinerea okayama7\|eukprot:XP_001838532.2 hypothetical protein CC1G_13152 [Coprinopsis cinerea okayama7\
MGRGNTRRYECEPPEKVYAYRAKLVKTKRNSAKIQLVPATFTTPKNKRRHTGESSKVYCCQCQGGIGVGETGIIAGDVFIPFDLPERDMTGGSNTSHSYLCEWREAKQEAYLDEMPTPSGDVTPAMGDLFYAPIAAGMAIEPILSIESRCGTKHTLHLLGFGDLDSFSLSAPPGAATSLQLRPLTYPTLYLCAMIPRMVPNLNDEPGKTTDLYPTSYKEARSAFTFELLDDYILQNLECHTSAFHYYSKLRRLTNKAFPKTVPDRYRELLRCSREWRRLKDLKRHGFGHLKRSPGEGEMALYCAACPQPGVNIPEGWQDDPEQWKYYVTLVADGNFTLLHRKQRGEDDVWLKNGEGYLVERTRYAKHISATTEKKEPQAPTCHEHRAVEDRSKTHKGCDVTGVGAFACSRHGAFAPGSVVDFQKGERQMNMDYGLCGAIRSTGASHARRLNLLYDIACQYCQHLVKRLKDGKYLNHWDSLEMVFGIGKFHVFGHQERCFVRHSPLFIEGTGWTSGEILESLWAILNEAGKATQTMTLAHRNEVLDSLIADSNFKKMINLVHQLGGRYVKSLKELTAAREAFELLDATASTAQRSAWQEQLNRALELRVHDVGAMDVLNVTIEKPPSRSKVQHDMMVNEQQGNYDVGVTSWLTLGLKIQESQLQLKAYIKSLPRADLRTDLQLVELMQRRERIQTDLDSFVATAVRLFPTVEFRGYDRPPDVAPEIDNDDPEDAEGTGLIEEEDNPFLNSDDCDIEDVEVPLPSSFTRLPETMTRARKKEIRLRIAQANDALEGIRTEIGHKSFLYRSNIRLADGKKQKTRGYQAIKAADSSLRHHLRLYNQSRWALNRLGAKPSTLERYRPIVREDTKAITAVYQPNAPGQSKATLSWIWSLDVKGDSDNSIYLNELYRVNWLRAKARLDRWKEEHVLLRSEMDWVINFFTMREQRCLSWAGLTSQQPGHSAYAFRQAEMWRLLASDAKMSFETAQKTVQSLKETSNGDWD